ncbi:hypothetical protein GCM10025882_10550 [Acinetobacter gyllenbergii]|uniref:DUF3396 domain-containing protein n=1 Tax=Acinetobacter gyllenbergii CIP 110306 = MTCC 11365 TaxID=1217657 RepID=A0A829HAL3_9GAMM|nr:type VI immunity family protein [Acinetobacter gyllenbergii]EPF69289.1 hypothetical protein F957_04164 [Acinetobacter gyllenbergii CIP 110306 = MTCC 11365]EPH33720.1 hypothetical protein L293_3999 [Acinetobacter gyllenbergii CIP 110306 = MTCC 11365]ESK36635.1 hypothetical protein F987_03771 [Acinetobacter gyllenbergii NIPH 230]GMA10631.1 hypothetical protein GCM10025882_10550 [Acinetobacter gyllenbergii]
MYLKTQEEYEAWAKTQSKGALGHGLFVAPAPEDYVGANLAIRAVLYFKEGYSDEMREAIAQCFDDYQTYANEHLTWLWQGSPPKGAGADCIAYSKLKPIREIFKLYSPMTPISFLYTSGKEKFETGAWEFNIGGISRWQFAKGTQQSTLTFAMPIEWVEEHSKAFIELFLNCARRLKAHHGYAGYACLISEIRSDKNEPTEAFFSRKMWAMDIGNPYLESDNLIHGIKTVNWLTAINTEWFNQIREEKALNIELPMSWFIGYDYGAGVVIQAGRLPLPGSIETDPLPAPYVLMNRVLKPLRVEKIGSFHRGNYSTDEIPLVKGYLADNWLKRFDIPESDVLDYFEKLQAEPKLSSKYAFLDRRVDWG